MGLEVGIALKGWRRKMMICVTGAKWTRQEMRSRGLGPDHTGFMGPEESEFHSKGNEKLLEGFRQVTGKIQLTLTNAL